MAWRVELGGEVPLLAECLQAQEIWRLLTKKQRAAILAAYPDEQVEAHPLTLNALERHGLIEPRGPIRRYTDPRGSHLTEAGRLIGKWNVKVIR